MPLLSLLSTCSAPRDYLERQNLKLTLATGQMEEFVTISIVDGAGFRDNVTVFGVLSTTDVGVTVGPEAMITIIEDERKCSIFVLLYK